MSDSESEYELDYQTGSDSDTSEVAMPSPITIPSKQQKGGSIKPIDSVESVAEIQKKKDKRAETSRLNLAKARARKLELAQLRKIEKAKDVITSHIVHEEETDSEESDESDEEIVVPKRKMKIGSSANPFGKKDGLVQQVTKLTKAKERKRKKEKDGEDRIRRLEQLLADQLTNAKKMAKKATRKPKTKTTIVQIEQPKTNDNLKNFAKAALLDLGL